MKREDDGLKPVPRVPFTLGVLLLSSAAGAAPRGGELRFCLRAEPTIFHPLRVEDDSSETIRYLTGGVLVRFNRLTQELQPELALSWNPYSPRMGKRGLRSARPLAESP